MNDLYTEASVRKKVTLGDTLVKFVTVLVVATVFILGWFLQMMIVTLAGTLGIVMAITLLPRLTTTYEYIFCDGQLDFDKIMGGEKRKHLYRLDFEQVLVMAPVNSHALDAYKNNDTARKLDFTSLEKDRKVYCIVVSTGQQMTLVYFEPNEKMVSYIKQKAPRKVSEY